MFRTLHPFLWLFVVVALAAVAGCSGAASMAPDATAPAGEAVPVEPGVLAVANVFARPSPETGGTGGVYLTVLNGLDQPLQLSSIDGAIAQAVELHETVNEQGVMRMVPHPEGFAVPALSSLELKPGGKHIMLIGLAAPLVAGDSFTLTLNFDGANPLTIDVPVGESGEAAPMHSHMPAHADLAPSGPAIADQQSDGIHGWLASTPLQPVKGTATIDAYLVADDGQPIEDAAVTFDVDMTNMSHGKYQVPARATGGGHYAGEVHFSMAGPWRIIAAVERPGHAAVDLRFDFKVNAE